MTKDAIELSQVRTAARRLIAVQQARIHLSRALRSLEASLPSVDRDLTFDLAMNAHAPKHWTAMPREAVEREVATQLGRRAFRAGRKRSMQAAG